MRSTELNLRHADTNKMMQLATSESFLEMFLSSSLKRSLFQPQTRHKGAIWSRSSTRCFSPNHPKHYRGPFNARFSSSSSKSNSLRSRQQLTRGNAEKLRKMREAKWRSYPASAGSENIDQRLAEEGNMEHQKHNRRQLHKAERKQSFEEKKRQKFVSFFDEVDSLMEEKYGHKSPSAEPSLLDILGEPSLLRTNPAVSPVTSDLCDRPNVAVDSRTPSSLTDVPSSVGSSRKSIFDFDVIPAAIPAADNKNAYEKNSYEQYYLFLQDAIAQMEKRKGLDKEVIEWLTKDERVVHSDLTILDDVIRDGGAISAKNSATGESSETVALRDQLKDQQEKFLESVTLTPGQLTQARTALKIIADLCAKRARAAPVEIAWEKIKEAGIIPSKGAMDTFLYVVSTGGLGLVSSISVPLDNYLLSQNAFPDQRSGSILDALKPLDGKLDSGSDEHSCDGSKSRDMKEEVSVFRDILYEPTERSISVRINSLVAKGNPKAAELLLEAFKVCLLRV